MNNSDAAELTFYRQVFGLSLSAVISAAATVLLASLVFFFLIRGTLDDIAEFFFYGVCIIVFLVGTGLLYFYVFKPNSL